MADIPLLHCIQLTKYYQRANLLIRVLNCITLSIQSNEMIAVVGASGSGKSTLLHLLGGLDKPTEGEIFFEGHALHKLTDSERSVIRNKRLGFVYQFHHLLLDFDVLENVAMPLLIGGIAFNQAKNRAQCILESVGLKNYIHSFPHELSGGESQRVTIARAIVNNPSLILADEPTGNLDQKNSDSIFQLLKKLNTYYGTTFLIATHDLNLAKQCHKIFLISNGKIKLSQNDSFR
ncbi:lipoprotein-releasing ABC transporter ATP-binding protein LolD [Blochmannia endosymbiont of Camponotus sp.]|uniref:lipoprotein-releasing ABC transporter ATP-binding protein LolD n=1 Tax=Blochmannia endosymbiont of Camponotus sp. TaxID=700220 RepID=UPI002023D1A7|nr:lipoprotein-releasing ABC transporter ATP-binding protein LolD [Blochmannia endosymbiont of Camponotus sp.]URJ23725.1 lipoprotein-releasing ABC transporter ATP-binding protein LolD [Blochmannia endosymbiont of Camponotus sp.]URJ25514.1 lipoprotein-releasing ABC transporter ATP-binding protein LolD [Blochmannia endosymbiont of Camponotus sp.]URJ32503.1 lipoprotein-releasing ABC transporter ATP-binding protein LolD [Blochmannia endosymbiont of Camponotus sp.]